MDNNDNSVQNKELEIEGNFAKEGKNISQIEQKFDKIMEENEEFTKNDEENNNINNEYEDSLSYSTFYRSSQSSFNKNSKDIELSIKRRFSTNFSNSQFNKNYQELNGTPSDKQYFSQKTIKRIHPINLFRNESNNLIPNYYKGTDCYFKSIYINNNDYQKSKNYIRKELFFKDYDECNNDFSDDNKNNLINEGNISNNSFISLNNKIFNNNEEKPFNEFNNKNNYINNTNSNIIINNTNNTNNTNSTNNTKNTDNTNNTNGERKNISNIYNINTTNNFYMNQIYLNPSLNFNNLNGSKYDLSMCYVGYYSVDCKSYIKINLYYFFLLFSIFRSTNCSIYPKKVKR